ncbi:Y-family DNA polymerase [Undibacterium arcticum]
MRVWIGVYLPLIPLEALRPSWCEQGEYALIDNDRVLVTSALAARSGVRCGMRRGGVSAIAPETTLLERDLVQEQRALDSVAMTLLQFTPEVTYAEGFAVLLDVTASQRLFGGCHLLCRRLSASIRALGFTARLGTAPTAQAAWLLARSKSDRSGPVRRRVMQMETMTRRLDRLPCSLLPAADLHRDWLQGIGCQVLGDLRKLPRAGLQRRTNKDLLEAMDRAYGMAPELFEWIKAPPVFGERLEMPDRIEHAEALLFGAQRLVLQMVGWLVALQQAVSRFVLLLEHERGRAAVPPTAIEIALAEPTWQEEHLIRLLKERLGRVELTAPVIAIRLSAETLSPMLPPTESLFPEPGGSPSDYKRLLELLVARLGNDKVLAPIPVSDHRPETCNRWGGRQPLPAQRPTRMKMTSRLTVHSGCWPSPSHCCCATTARSMVRR